MKLSLRMLLTSLALALAYGGLIIASPDATRKFGLDVWNYSHDEADYREAREQLGQTVALNENARRRVRMKQNVLLDLIGGRTSFSEAVRLVAELDHQPPEIMTQLRAIHPSLTEEQAVGWQVIEGVRMLLAHDQSQRDKLVRRLERELQGWPADRGDPVEVH
jgi:hypothetical protein